MPSALILKILLSVLTTATIAGIVWRARKHPNRSQEYPQQRMLQFVAALGWLFLAAGSLLGLLSFGTADVPLGAKISSVTILLGGAAFVLMYRNFYLAPRTYEVAFRSVLGTEHVIPYSEIAQYRVQMLKGMPFLRLKSIHGLTLNLNISTYDMTPLIRAIDHHQATGRWPVPATVPDR